MLENLVALLLLPLGTSDDALQDVGTHIPLCISSGEYATRYPEAVLNLRAKLHMLGRLSHENLLQVQERHQH